MRSRSRAGVVDNGLAAARSGIHASMGRIRTVYQTGPATAK